MTKRAKSPDLRRRSGGRERPPDAIAPAPLHRLPAALLGVPAPRDAMPQVCAEACAAPPLPDDVLNPRLSSRLARALAPEVAAGEAAVRRARREAHRLHRCKLVAQDELDIRLDAMSAHYLAQRPWLREGCIAHADDAGNDEGDADPAMETA